MDAQGGETLEERVSRLERSISAISDRIDGLRGAAASPGAIPPSRAPTPRRPVANPLQGKSAEWWLARGGAILTCVAVILLYQYAVEKNWITPFVRVVIGSLIGAGLMTAGFRTAPDRSSSSQEAVGLREALMGAALSAWYISAYAAAVLYQLIPAGNARVVFLAISIGGIWLSLRENRALLALLALGAGFIAPSLLVSADPSITAFALYLAALTGIGMIVYLMRGWQSVLLLSFIAFWWSAGDGASPFAPIAMTIVVIAAGFVMTRVPSLRRQLVQTGSELYTEPRRSEPVREWLAQISARVSSFATYPASADSATLWIVTLATPLLAVLVLSWLWVAVDNAWWALMTAALSGFAFWLESKKASDEEFRHVAMAAATLWSIATAVWLASGTGTQSAPSEALLIALLSSYAFLRFRSLKDSSYGAAKKILLIAAAFVILAVICSETVYSSMSWASQSGWTLAELLAIAMGGWIWWALRLSAPGSTVSKGFGLATYLALLLVDARVLGHVWQPLVTTSYAVAGTILLVMAEKSFDSLTVRRLGGFTLVLVVGRLMLVDLARVETIWRVLLFLLCGALFLFTSYRLQSSRKVSA